jgi:DNA-binding transcriptional LysR family regulator
MRVSALPSVKELEAFAAVAEAGSFEGAARRLNATSPAISKRISELETELGVRLFERSTRRCQITLRGRALLLIAERILGDIGEIHRTVSDRSSLSGLIRFGVVETIAYTQLSPILRKASYELPQLRISVEVGFSTDLIPRVRDHELDIACVVGPVFEPELISEAFWEVPLSWITAGPTWTEKPLTIEALSRQTLLLPTGGRYLATIERWFKRRGLRPKDIIICNSLTTTVKMTAIGMGFSLMPIECAQQELDAGLVTLVPVKEKLPANVFVMTYPVGQREPALEAFAGILREISATLLGKSASRPKPI